MNKSIIGLQILMAIFLGNRAQAFKCPTDSIPVTEPRYYFSGQNYQGAKDLEIPNNGSITICLKVQKRSDYLMLPYYLSRDTNRIAKFSGKGVDLRNLPIVKSLKGYFEDETVLINVTSVAADANACTVNPFVCEKPLKISVFWRKETGPTPIETTCKNGFLPPYFNPITQDYTANVYGYRQVELLRTEPKKYCYFLSETVRSLQLYIADRTGPAQCGYHIATYTPPQGNQFLPSTFDGINSNRRFMSTSDSHLPRGIYTIEAISTSPYMDCSNKMEIAAIPRPF